MKIHKFLFAGVAAVSIAALSACSSNAPVAEGEGAEGPITIRVQSQPSISSEPMYMGIEKGFFTEEGCEVEVVELPDIVAATAALQAGKLELAFIPTISGLQMARQNIPITMIAASDGINPLAFDAPMEEKRNYTGVGIYASLGSGIETYADLAGKTIAVPELKGQPDGTIISVLQDEGIDTSGIEWLKLGFQPALDALKADQIDAAFLVSPFWSEAEAVGMKRIMSPSAVFFPQGAATTAWTGNSEWVKNNPEAVACFQRGIARSAEYANANLQETKEHVIDRTGLKVDPSDLPEVFFPQNIDPDQLAEIDKKLVSIGFFDEPIDVTTILATSGN